MQTENEEGFVPCDCARGGGYPGCSEFWRLKRAGDTDGADAHRNAAVVTERDARRAMYEQGDWVLRMERMRVPAPAIVALRNPQENACLIAAKKYLAGDRRLVPGLVLVGPTGLGKTVAAAFVMRDLVRKYDFNGQPTGDFPPPCMFIPARKFTTLSSFDAGDRELYADAQRTKLLALDDLGDEAHDFGKARLIDLLMERIDSRRATVLTSNLSMEAFRKRYGEALYDRIRSASIVPKLEGGTLRKKPEVRP